MDGALISGSHLCGLMKGPFDDFMLHVIPVGGTGRSSGRSAGLDSASLSYSHMGSDSSQYDAQRNKST